MDLSRLSKGDLVIAVSGALLLACSFLDWLGLKATDRASQFGVPASSTVSKSAWAFPVTLVAVAIGVAMLLIVVLKLLGADLPKPGPLTWGQVLLVMGVVTFVLVVVKLAVGPSEWSLNGNAISVNDIEKFCLQQGPKCADFSTTRGVGIILGTLAAAGLLVGGYLRHQEDTSTPQAAGARSVKV